MSDVGWSLEAYPEFEREYRRLCARNAGFKRAVDRKIEQILRAPLHYKPLRGPMQGLRRVHIAGSFVLLFEANEARAVVTLVRLAHHDDAYGV